MPTQKRCALAVVISGPSGAGKTTFAKRLAEKHGYEISVSATTRQPRPGEKGGVAYHFYTRQRFEDGIRQGEFLEHSEHFGNLYGTPRRPVEQALAEGRSILLEIDINGGRQVLEKLPSAFSIFLVAPDDQETERRLRGRKSEDEDEIRRRRARAQVEIAEQTRYHVVLINDILDRAVDEAHDLIRQEEEKRANGC